MRGVGRSLSNAGFLPGIHLTVAGLETRLHMLKKPARRRRLSIPTAPRFVIGQNAHHAFERESLELAPFPMSVVEISSRARGLTPTLYGIAKSELRQITLSVNDFQLAL